MKRLYGLYLMIILLMILTYLFFKPFYSQEGWPPYASEIIAAILGALFTTLITSLLLEKQTEVEEKKEKNIGIYEKKFSVYSKFIKTYNDVPKDREKFNECHLKMLVRSACDIYLVTTTKEVIKKLNKFLFFVTVNKIFYEDQFKNNKFGLVCDEIKEWLIKYNKSDLSADCEISIPDEIRARLYKIYESREPIDELRDNELFRYNEMLKSSFESIGTLIHAFRADLASDKIDSILEKDLESIDEFVL